MPIDGMFAPARVRSVTSVASDVRQFEIVPEAGTKPYAIGSHLDIQVRVDARIEHRSFSLVGDRAPDDVYRLAIKNRPDGCGGSLYLWSLSVGDRVMISDPIDQFPLFFRAPQYRLVAGGIGITPLYGMALSLARRGADLRLYFAAHSEDQFAYLDELQQALGDRLERCVGERGQRLDPGKILHGLHPQGELYVCGPVGLRESLQRAWQADGRSPARFRFETFASGGHFQDRPFEVEVVNRGVRFVVERGQTLLQALYAHGIDDVLYDCERGECGLCAVRVVGCEGQIDHRDVFYTERQRAAGNRLCACVSRVVGGRVSIDTSHQLVDAGQPET